MEDTIKLPLDADGVPIRPGDVVYSLRRKDPKPKIVRELLFTGAEPIQWSIVLKDGLSYVPNSFSHTKPDTLESIEQALDELAKAAACGCTTDVEIKDDISYLMERIKRMVER